MRALRDAEGAQEPMFLFFKLLARRGHGRCLWIRGSRHVPLAAL